MKNNLRRNIGGTVMVKFLIGAAIAAAAIAGAIYALATPDIPRDVLIAKYA